MLSWMRRHGTISAVGVEGCGAYGAGLARHLDRNGVHVIEVPRPDRRLRRNRGKSDPIDAEAAARSVLAGTATVHPKLADGPIEAIRALRVARLGAVKAKTATTNSLKAMVITAPDPLRTQLSGLTTIQLVNTCSRFRPDLSELDDPTQATKAAMRSIATRARHLIDESRALKRLLADAELDKDMLREIASETSNPEPQASSSHHAARPVRGLATPSLHRGRHPSIHDAIAPAADHRRRSRAARLAAQVRHGSSPLGLASCRQARPPGGLEGQQQADPPPVA